MSENEPHRASPEEVASSSRHRRILVLLTGILVLLPLVLAALRLLGYL